MNLRILTLAAATMMLGVNVACAKQSPQPAAVAAPTAVAPQTDTVAVHSAAMDRDIKNTVIVPQQYLVPGDTARWPVVYLLHGADGSYRDWPRKARLDSLATRYGVIIVCPDGQDSWYFDSPVDPTMQFETYVGTELVQWIDAHYRTRAAREGRAITGLSMGGHGALWIGWRHPDVFAQTGSMSGGENLAPFPHPGVIPALPG